MTAPAVTAADPADAVRVASLQALRSEPAAGTGSGPLARLVQEKLSYLWESGGHRDAVAPGHRPDSIFIRLGYLATRPDHRYGPVLPRLIQSKGLQLRLHLLMLFDAQCRHGVGEEFVSVREINPVPGDPYAAWRQLVLTASVPTIGTSRTAADLRARQIAEAMVALEGKHLLRIPRDKANRRVYGQAKLLMEDGNVDESAGYVVPKTGVWVPREFFTSLWLFALSDIELATFLALSAQRFRFPLRHHEQGIFLLESEREALFRLKPATWRATVMLHRFGLITRQPQRGRTYGTGAVGNFAKRWQQRQVMPVLYQLADRTLLAQPALDVIHRVLVEPTAHDMNRRDQPPLVFDAAGAGSS